jgi:hypothetical protein
MKPAREPHAPPEPTQQLQTSPFSVVGWLLAMIAVIPLVMGGHGVMGGRGEGQVLLIAGGVLLTLGVVLILVGKAKGGKPAAPTTGSK